MPSCCCGDPAPAAKCAAGAASVCTPRAAGASILATMRKRADVMCADAPLPSVTYGWGKPGQTEEPARRGGAAALGFGVAPRRRMRPAPMRRPRPRGRAASASRCCVRARWTRWPTRTATRSTGRTEQGAGSHVGFFLAGCARPSYVTVVAGGVSPAAGRGGPPRARAHDACAPAACGGWERQMCARAAAGW